MSITKNCPILEQLHGNIIITDAGLIEFGKRCPQLITFNLTRFTDVGVMALAEGCRGLKDISIENDSTHDGISDASILKLTESCEYLEYLGLNAFSKLTDESLGAIARNCKYLKELGLGNLPSISNLGLITFFSSPNISCLRFAYFDKVDLFDDSVLELVKNNKSTLTNLTISSCENVTDVGMSYIANYCTRLTELELKRLPCVSHPVYIAEILKRNPNLTLLSVHALGLQNRICSVSDELCPMLQSLLDENVKKGES